MDEIEIKVKQFKEGSGPAPIESQLKKKGGGKIKFSVEAFKCDDPPKKKKGKKSSGARKSSSSKKGKLTDGNLITEPVNTVYDTTYKIHIEAVRATGLMAADKNGKSDPYCVFQLEGGNQKYMTKYVENKLDPVWNEKIPPLDGYYVSSDLLHIWVYDKDRKVDLKKNDCIAYGKLVINDIGPLGEINEVDVSLYTVNQDKKANTVAPKKNSHRGDAGHVILRIHVSQIKDVPFVAKPWTHEFLMCCLELNKATKCPVIGDTSSDPYVIMHIYPAANSQQYRTIVQKNTLNPIWNEQFTFYVDDPKSQKINFTMMHEQIQMGHVTIYLNDMELNQPIHMEVQLENNNKDVKGGILDYRLVLYHKGERPFVNTEETPKERDVEIKEKSSSSSSSSSSSKCKFSFGTYSSSYSTSFSGYTTCSTTLSNIHSSEEKYHVHEIKTKQEYHGKPKKHAITGKFIGCTDLIKTELNGTDAYVKISLRNKGGKVKGEEFTTEVVKNTSDPTYDLPLTFKDAKKGDYIDITVYHDFTLLGTRAIGAAKVPIKDVQEQTTLNLDLHKPEGSKLPKELSKLLDYGHCSIELSANYE
ncbi:putative C2 domain containing protein [Tritrichomonas foetus]|uniref:Putative C2 domain containing protein n=1 Tax=Tritrichomonas foetus TaxID=1144522 RepID=A0A1J4KC53_9EUKA|nr:putative C2 domain containing protein [Tritrichomonas foetus]OHT08803.1 putative C2 domain containing protein [Tritrichomonas foetus]|eukprot:OHT08803.1 putative C2 domain containing protein [Tritrichomonas foetus]